MSGEQEMIRRNNQGSAVKQNRRAPRGAIDMRPAEESRMNISRGSGQGIYLSSEWRPPIGKTYLFEVYQRCLLCGISPLQRKRKGEDPRQPQPSLLRGRVLGGYTRYLEAPRNAFTAVYEQHFFSARWIFSESDHNRKKQQLEERSSSNR